MTTAGRTASAERIPSLDGLRAISIALVIFSHLAGTRGFPVSAAAANPWSLGGFGVTVFFVISGFLITGLLLEELARSDRIRLGRFYFRRTLRIFPPYFTLIAALLVADGLGWISLNPRDALHAATYTSNYHDARSWFVGHTWSLSVEEQFYLLWPAVLVLARSRRAVFIAAAAVLIVPFIRVAEWELFRSAGHGVGYRFETIADSIAAGCVLACVRPALHQSPRYMRLLRSPAFILIPVAALAGNWMHDHPLVSFGLGLSVMNVCLALCLDWCVTFPDGRIGRVLNAAPLVFVGWISYSLYLWQQPFLDRESAAVTAQFPYNIALTVVAALASYYVVERPSLQLRKRIEARRRRPVPAPPVGPDPRTGAATPVAAMD
jgi:peptidoglycan/LPS O-acetylase OafA/YrhL